MTKKRNGNIEIMRFIFCILVILFHCHNAIDMKIPHPFEFFREGKIGVEFFFLVSGYLLAKTASKHYETKSITKDTQSFLYKKLLSVLPYHVIVYLGCLVITFAVSEKLGLKSGFMTFIDTLPNFFFIQSSGVHKKLLVTPEWYVAAMLIVMTAIYPLVLKFKKNFTRFACPLIVIVSIGYMIHIQGKLGGTERWVFDESFPKVYLRAFCEICGGAFCYEIAEFIKNLNYSKLDKLILTLIEFTCYALPIIYTFLDLPQHYEAYAFYSLAIAVTLTFSEVTYFSGLFNNKVAYAMGRFSLPLYYTQRFAFILVKNTALSQMRVRNQLIFCLALTFVTALILEPVSKLFMKGFDSKVKALRSKDELTKTA